jgi:hypothetical protein
MADYTLSSVNRDAEIEINQIEPTPTLPRGGYQIRITSHDPNPARTAITVEQDDLAELLGRILSGDHSLLRDVRQRLLTGGQRILEDMAPTG